VKTVEEATNKIDVIVHEAAITSVPRSVRCPKLTMDVNVSGTLNLLKLGLERDIKRFVFASSCAVYGEAEELPIPETAKPKPSSPYASTKLSGESSCLKFLGKGLDTVCLRYFNVYGPRQGMGEYAGVILRFLDRLKDAQRPVIYGDGEQTRDFVHVNDVVKATISAIKSEDAVGEVINIGTGEATTINKLCSVLLKITKNQSLKPIYKDARAGDVRHSQADITKAKEILDYTPDISLKKGLKDLQGQIKNHAENKN
ncbi:hypothetical protein AKJ43_02415, partial [candidate division MSBL1 archaeon SCGC-AAA261D19]